MDPRFGCVVLLGDTAGSISFYTMSFGGDSNCQINPTSCQHVGVSPLFTLAPSHIGQQSLYTTPFSSSTGNDGDADFRLLDLKVRSTGCVHRCFSFIILM